MMNGTDLQGHDYYNFKMSVADPRICQEACCNDSNCAAWAYANPQPFIAKSNLGFFGNCKEGDVCCWLKNQVPQPTPEAHVTSGVVQSGMKLGLLTSNSSLSPLVNKTNYVVPIMATKQRTFQPRATDPYQCMAVPIMYGTDMPGGDYQTVNMSMADPANCKQLCCANSWCQGWTMASPNPGATTNCSLNGTCCYLKTQPGSPTPHSVCVSGSSNSSPSTFHATFDVFIDHSVVEVYAEDGDVAITSRIYPTLPDSIGVELFADNASALFQLTAWQMADM
jgi:hypothetical protein